MPKQLIRSSTGGFPPRRGDVTPLGSIMLFRSELKATLQRNKQSFFLRKGVGIDSGSIKQRIRTCLYALGRGRGEGGGM
jgi:hypothetical protein